MTALQTAPAERAPRRAPDPRTPARHRAGTAARPGVRTHARPTPGAPPTQRRLRAVPTAVPAAQAIPTWAYSLVAGIILSVGVIGIVALNALAAEASFQARALAAEISDLTLRHDDLVAEVATLEAPARVRQVARSQLGLIEPEQPGFLVLDPAQLDPAEPKAEIRLTDPDRLISAQG